MRTLGLVSVSADPQMRDRARQLSFGKVICKRKTERRGGRKKEEGERGEKERERGGEREKERERERERERKRETQR